MKSLNSSKSHRLFDFVPSVKPSVVSVILVFVCGFLWVKNETTNKRLIALESRLHCFSCVRSGSTENLDKMALSPTRDSAKYHDKNIRTRISKGIGHTSVVPFSRMEFITIPPRNRRDLVKDTSVSITIHDVRREISKQFEQLCMPGPKCMPGPTGRPGKSISAPQVMLSPAEQTRDEGGNTAFYCTVKGNPCPDVEWRFKSKKLVSGAKYLIKEGELIVENLNYSDAGQYTCHARNIRGSSQVTGNLSVRGLPIFTKVPPSCATPIQRTTYQVVCQAEGFPSPVINWRRVGMPLPAGRTEVNQGTVTIKNLTSADSGLYECIATNTVGTKRARTNVTVKRKPDLEDSVIVGNSGNYLRTLRSWLSPVARSVNSTWKLCWRASVDGWAGSTFHSRCDGKGPTVTIIRVGKYIFGGYTSLSWDSSYQYQYDSKAFLFSLVNKPRWAPVKLPQAGKYSYYRSYSTNSYKSFGPLFGGGHDIYISNYASSNSNSFSNLGYTYSPPSGYTLYSTFARTFLAGTYYFTPDEVETFYETN